MKTIEPRGTGALSARGTRRPDEAIEAFMENDPIRLYISDRLQIDGDLLNEISIGDVRFSEPARQDINRSVAPLLEAGREASEAPGQASDGIGALPCKSFWIEGTCDLVLFIWIGTRARTLLVEPDGWRLREDVSVH